jgi:hypothetical protein
MRCDYTTQRFQVFVRDLQESFWDDFQGRTREALKNLLEADSQQQMVYYLELKWHERARPEQPRAGRIFATASTSGTT